MENEEQKSDLYILVLVIYKLLPDSLEKKFIPLSEIMNVYAVKLHGIKEKDIKRVITSSPSAALFTYRYMNGNLEFKVSDNIIHGVNLG